MAIVKKFILRKPMDVTAAMAILSTRREMFLKGVANVYNNFVNLLRTRMSVLRLTKHRTILQMRTYKQKHSDHLAS